ncbi:MAG: hypothetical protein LPK26_11660 [Bacillaceae bacterium]|uniref:Uncharacterized protein n=1 Tax=Alkalihalobacterium chitinilyticum TaxID=2980103 RepID=A0ABT5VLR5_9BACI|nr:hypothetical protein [Alkalihalobacterium chitinilyticum]MDE5415722.1 hypothetical protein [Alkalihalobacterium chitinilyticum]MEB1807925.1 hypothetical protein [Bacillaceae bacterium]
MVEALLFGIAIFFGWVIFDFVKHKKFSKENILSALVVGVIGGVAWYIIEWIF